MSISAFFLISYGALRTFSELFRAPDTHIGFLFVGTTMGQLLSIPMILIGLLLMWISYREKDYDYPTKYGALSILVTHPTGCEVDVQNQINYVKNKVGCIMVLREYDYWRFGRIWLGFEN